MLGLRPFCFTIFITSVVYVRYRKDYTTLDMACAAWDLALGTLYIYQTLLGTIQLDETNILLPGVLHSALIR